MGDSAAKKKAGGWRDGVEGRRACCAAEFLPLLCEEPKPKDGVKALALPFSSFPPQLKFL